MKARAAFVASFITLAATAAAAQAPQPNISNGKVEVRTGTGIDREITAVSAPNSTEAVWLAWRAPMVPGDRDLCGSWYVDRWGAFRGEMLGDQSIQVIGDAVTSVTPKPQFATPTGPVPLEGGTSLLVLVRAVGGRLERLRTIGDDCPLDAGGRTVYWLPGVTPAESLRYLTGLARAQQTDRALTSSERTIADSAVRAIGYHRDASADGVLEQIATSHPDQDVRRQAVLTIAGLRGASGLAFVNKLLATEKDSTRRRSLVTALGRSQEPSVVGHLRALTKDPDPGVRADASSLLVTRGGASVVPEALTILNNDADDTVKRRIVSAIGRLPADAGIPHLIQLARTTSSPVVRKEAVSVISQSKDPRAIAFLEEIIKR
jgi:hypothetical protein